MLYPPSALIVVVVKIPRTYVAEVVNNNIFVVVGDMGKLLIIAESCVSPPQLHVRGTGKRRGLVVKIASTQVYVMRL